MILLIISLIVAFLINPFLVVLVIVRWLAFAGAKKYGLHNKYNKFIGKIKKNSQFK